MYNFHPYTDLIQQSSLFVCFYSQFWNLTLNISHSLTLGLCMCVCLSLSLVWEYENNIH